MLINHHPRREDQRYHINVSKDGSMITAVPIIVDGRGGFTARGGRGRGGVLGKGAGRVGFDSRPPSLSSCRWPPPPPGPPRASPIVFGRPRSSPLTSDKAGSSRLSSWPTPGLLEARGKQRRKMRSSGYMTRLAAVATRRADVTIHATKDRLKQASKGFLTFAARGGGGGGGGTTATTTKSGNIDNNNNDDDHGSDGNHPRDDTLGDRLPSHGCQKHRHEI